MRNFGVAIFIFLVFVCVDIYFRSIAYADEPDKDCTYVAKPSDLVYYTCGEQTIGTVELKLWICGQRYIIDMKCPK